MLPVAQGIAGVPLFSGASVGLAVFVIAIVAAVGYFVFRLRHDKYEVLTSLPVEAAITGSQKFVLGVIALATVILVWAAPEFKWHNGELNRPGFVGDRRVWRYAARAGSARFRL